MARTIDSRNMKTAARAQRLKSKPPMPFARTGTRSWKIAACRGGPRITIAQNQEQASRCSRVPHVPHSSSRATPFVTCGEWYRVAKSVCTGKKGWPQRRNNRNRCTQFLPHPRCGTPSGGRYVRQTDTGGGGRPPEAFLSSCAGPAKMVAAVLAAGAAAIAQTTRKFCRKQSPVSTKPALFSRTMRLGGGHPQEPPVVLW